jgi:hypothetical protein
MSDRLALTEAIEAGGIERAKATRIASVIFDAIHQNVATKADLEPVKAEIIRVELSLKAELVTVRSELRDEMRSGVAALDGKIARQDVAVERVRLAVRETESRLLVRLGGLVVATATVLGALQHLWPP